MITNRFIDTKLDAEYREFVNSEFDYIKINEWFTNFDVNEMAGWIEYSDDNTKLEFYSKDMPYKIITDIYNLELPYPKTIDDFISDCSRSGMQLYWSELIVDRFDISVLMNQNDIETYYKKLLIKIDKE